MPELPEVETVKRGLEPVLAGATIQSITLNRPDLRVPFPEKLHEQLQWKKCLSLDRRGKYILIHLEENLTLIIHLGMSGQMVINPSAPRKHDHMVIETKAGDIITFNDPRRFGMVYLAKTTEIDSHKAFHGMGYEPLNQALTADIFYNLLHKRKISMKAALLDQRLIAGIGNIYACEALYLAGISPYRLSNDISLEDADRLLNAVRAVLKDAIKSGGSSLRDHRQANGSMGYFQHHFKVYDREGKACLATGEVIIRVVQNGRSTFYCPAIQI
jgi:formamidopyrimidine-DNA glycosylase